MHESTVSRVTSNKYLLCDRGLFELKYFFGSGVAVGRRARARRPKRSRPAISELIDAETEILSDDAIAGLLKQRGFDVARRTVVKYREAMGIGSSIQRRRQRKIAGGLGATAAPRSADGRTRAAPPGSCARRPPRCCRSLSTMIRSSAATGWRAWKLGPVGAMWNSRLEVLEAAGARRAIRWCRPSAPSASSAAAARSLEDRAHLPPAPQAGQIEVHADHAQRPVADQQLGHAPRRAARASAARAPRSRARRYAASPGSHCRASRCCGC